MTDVKFMVKSLESLNEILKNSSPKLIGFWEESKYVFGSGQYILGEEFIDGDRFVTIINAD